MLTWRPLEERETSQETVEVGGNKAPRARQQLTKARPDFAGTAAFASTPLLQLLHCTQDWLTILVFDKISGVVVVSSRLNGPQMPSDLLQFDM